MACEPGFTGVGAFANIAEAFADLLGLGTCEAAGWVLGIILTVIIVVSLVWMLGSDVLSGFSIAIPFGLGVVLSVLVGFWPIWTLIIIGLAIALVIVRPFLGD